jgi:hypothetical protein
MALLVRIAVVIKGPGLAGPFRRASGLVEPCFERDVDIGAREQVNSHGLSDATLGSHTSVSCLAGSLCNRAAARLERALTALGVDHDVKVYPGAGHGFINHHDPADRTLLLMFLNKVSGTRLHEPSAADAHRRIAALFSRHLATRPPSPDWMAG